MPKRTGVKKIPIIGSGPIVTGQTGEYDYTAYATCTTTADAMAAVFYASALPINPRHSFPPFRARTPR